MCFINTQQKPKKGNVNTRCEVGLLTNRCRRRRTTARLVPGTSYFVSADQNDLSILTNLLLVIVLFLFLIT